MKNIDCLCNLPLNEWAVVKRIDTVGSMRRRFLDIGLISGTRVSCVGESPLGNLRSYLIKGAVIAIRDGDAKGIVIEREGAEK